MRTVRAAVTALLAALLSLPAFALAEPSPSLVPPAVSAESAFLMEASSGRILLEKNADKRMEQASTTKIMTALVAIEVGGLDRIVTVTEAAAGTEGSSIHLKAGETLPLLELLYGLMLQSGNDAAVAIALAVDGSVDKFVQRMNEKAAALGLVNTHFQNPNGLHAPEHYTTARELALLSAAAMQNETFRTIVGTTYRVCEGCSSTRSFRNKNRFLTEYPGCNGVKTGYTKAAGKCLSFAASRDGMQLVGTVLNAPKMWDDARAILDFGFSNYESHLIRSASEIFTVSVRGGEKTSLPAGLKCDILYPMRSDGAEAVSVSVSLKESVQAPVAAGDTLGTVRVTVNGEAVAEAPILARESVNRRGFGFAVRKLIGDWTGR
ncbi:MAG: D-alanyl-D-alanine carboxypeptidase [Clostridia bacterium]|nr:D-alanyl-D-alanine carboxypeptidase [Clostridia bacterium]